ncbi:MAG: ribose 5-phosphate isomerase B [Paracoccaceae bacterium]|jgi:ribose 5-phosphate isomerase B
MSKELIGIAVDHGGFALKQPIVEELHSLGFEVLDLGTYDEESVDYPDIAEKLVGAFKDNRIDRGVLVCGTGIGISIAANRHAGIRAALCYDDETAMLSRQHNDANVMCLGGRKTGPDQAREMIRIFLATKFEGGRHARRVDKLG